MAGSQLTAFRILYLGRATTRERERVHSPPRCSLLDMGHREARVNTCGVFRGR